jgi:hypothetical protein
MTNATFNWIPLPYKIVVTVLTVAIQIISLDNHKSTFCQNPPNAWQIADGKLYLNYNRKVQQMWQEDIPGNIEKADMNWPGVLK